MHEEQDTFACRQPGSAVLAAVIPWQECVVLAWSHDSCASAARACAAASPLP
jgi:hypothetical protein